MIQINMWSEFFMRMGVDRFQAFLFNDYTILN